MFLYSMIHQNCLVSYICVISLLLFKYNGVYQVRGEVGGQDLFTSLAQLEVLWHNEIKVVNLMERMISKMDKAPSALKL